MKNYQGKNIIRRSSQALPYYADQTVIDRLADHLESVYPEEGCGFLIGEERDQVRSFHHLIPTENVYEGDKKRHFEIHPLAFQQAEQKAEKRGYTLLGIYHSHPDHPSMPSSTDLSIAMPFFSYLIASIRTGKLESVQSWRLTDDRSAFIEETFIKNQ